MVKKQREKIVVAVSGGFDPVHIGHIRMFEAAKKLGDTLVVIVNGDSWLMRKKRFVFMSASERAEIIRALKPVDEVYIHESNSDDVGEALAIIRPNIFANGGDRKKKRDLPEADVCRQYGIKLVFRVGGDKVQSSSWLTAKIGKNPVRTA